MRKSFLISLILTSILFMGCSEITENPVPVQEKVMVTDIVDESEVVYKRDTNLSKEDEEILNNLEYFINSGIVDYKSGKIYKGLMKNVSSGDSVISRESDYWLAENTEDIDNIELEKVITDNTDIELIETFKKGSDYNKYVVLIKIKTPNIATNYYNKLDTILADKDLNELCNLSIKDMIEDFNNSNDKNYTEKIYALSTDEVPIGNIQISTTPGFYDALTGNLYTAMNGSLEVSKYDEEMINSIEKSFSLCMEALSRTKLDDYLRKVNSDYNLPKEYIGNIDSDLKLTIIKYIAKNSKLEVVGLHNTNEVLEFEDSKDKYIPGKITYILTYPDVEYTINRLTYEGNSISDVKDKLSNMIYSDTIENTSLIITDDIRLSENGDTIISDGLRLYNFIKYIAYINLDYIGE